MAELTRRYIVMTMSAEGPFDTEDRDAPFVLKPWKDPAALQALEAYRAHCYPELADEISGWIQRIRQGPVAHGGVGARNAATLALRAERAPDGKSSTSRRPRPARSVAKARAHGRRQSRSRRAAPPRKARSRRRGRRNG